jgi:probable HAF family extracellular repeat protein
MEVIQRSAPARAAARILLAPLIAAALALSASHARAATYSIVDLGTLAQGTSTVVRGPNLAGTAVGAGRLADLGRSMGLPSALLFERGAALPVQGPAGTNTATLLGINDGGIVVGAANGPSAVRAFAGTRAGASRELPPLPGDNASVAYAINNSGQAVGYSSGPEGERAVSWTPAGQPTALVAPRGAPARAYGLNQRGDSVGVAGYASERRPVLWSVTGAVNELAVLPGFVAGEAAWVNSQGDVVGYSATPAELRHATVWPATGGVLDLGTLAGGSASQAFGINDAGAVVGSSESTRGLRAFIWSRAEGMRDLNGMLVAANVILTKAVGINNAGMIVALGHDPADDHGDGHDHERPIRVVLLLPMGV